MIFLPKGYGAKKPCLSKGKMKLNSQKIKEEPRLVRFHFSTSMTQMNVFHKLREQKLCQYRPLLKRMPELPPIRQRSQLGEFILFRLVAYLTHKYLRIYSKIS
jgi:hypothetical protein